MHLLLQPWPTAFAREFSGKFCKGSNRVHLRLILKSVPSISKHSDFFFPELRVAPSPLSL